MDQNPDRGGRPHVTPGEPSERIGPFTIGKGLADWFRVHAEATGISQGQLFRDALQRFRTSTERQKPKPGAS